MAQGDYLFPIPGTKRVKYLEENAGAMDVTLSEEDLNRLNKIFDDVAGSRYPEEMMNSLNR
jgi:aryl-alcohol dehydrogenase-like predicted oxidoreductase